MTRSIFVDFEAFLDDLAEMRERIAAGREWSLCESDATSPLEREAEAMVALSALPGAAIPSLGAY